MIKIDNIPNEIKQKHNWLVWKYEPRKNSKKLAKSPYNPIAKRRAKVNNPADFQPFDICLNAIGSYNGIGFVFRKEDRIIGIDLDNCRDPETGQIEEWALKKVKEFHSFTEISVSGTGLHILIHGHIASGKRRGNIEVYGDGRYFTVSGQHLEGTPKTIEHRGGGIERLYNELTQGQNESFNFELRQAQSRDYPPTPTRVYHNNIITPVASVLDDPLKPAKNDSKFQDLFSGDWHSLGYSSQSEADLALCQKLAFYTQGNGQQIDYYFRQSGLMRQKWDKNKTYARNTVNKALNTTPKYYNTDYNKRLAPPSKTPSITSTPYQEKKYIGNPEDKDIEHLFLCVGTEKGRELYAQMGKQKLKTLIVCAPTIKLLPSIAKNLKQKYPKVKQPIVHVDYDPNGNWFKYGDATARKLWGKLELASKTFSDEKILNFTYVLNIKYPRFDKSKCINLYLNMLGLEPAEVPEKIYQLIEQQADNLIKKKVEGLRHTGFKKAIEQYELNDITTVLPYGEYIPDDFVPCERGITLLAAGMGSGKTTLMARDAQKCLNNGLYLNLFIAPMRSIVSMGANKLNFTHYSDVIQEESDILSAHNIAVTPHSLHKFINNSGDNNSEDNIAIGTVYIDEFEKTLNDVFASDNTVLKEQASSRFAVFRKVIKCAQKVVIGDAGLSENALKLLESLRPQDFYSKNIKILIQDYPYDNGLNLHFVERRDDLLNLVVNACKEGKRILMSCSSREKTEIIKRLVPLECPSEQEIPSDLKTLSDDDDNPFGSANDTSFTNGNKILAINSITAGDNSDLIQQLNSSNLNNRLIDNYQLFIYSPAIGVGVSIDKDVKPFDLVVSFIDGKVHDIYDAWQQLGRYRKKTDIYVNIVNSNKDNAITDPKEIYDSRIKGHIHDLKKSKNVNKKLLDFLQNSEFNPKCFDFNHMKVHVMARHNRNSQNFINNFLLLGIARGYKIQYYQPDNKVSYKNSYKASKIDWQNHKTEETIYAEKINQKQYESIVMASNSTSDNYYECAQFALRQFHCIDEGEDLSQFDWLIKRDDKGKYRAQIRNAELLLQSLDDTTIKYIERLEENNPISTKQLITLREFGLDLMKLIDIIPGYTSNGNKEERINLYGLSLGNIDKTVTPKEVLSCKKYKEFCKKWKDRKQTLSNLGLRMRDDYKTSLRWLLQCVKQYGIYFDSQVVRDGKETIRKYRVQQDELDLFNSILKRRYEHLLNKEQQETLKNQKYEREIALKQQQVELARQEIIKLIQRSDDSQVSYYDLLATHSLESIDSALSDLIISGLITSQKSYEYTIITKPHIPTDEKIPETKATDTEELEANSHEGYDDIFDTISDWVIDDRKWALTQLKKIPFTEQLAIKNQYVNLYKTQGNREANAYLRELAYSR